MWYNFSPGFEGRFCTKFYEKVCIATLSSTALPGQSIYWRKVDCSVNNGRGDGDPNNCHKIEPTPPFVATGLSFSRVPSVDGLIELSVLNGFKLVIAFYFSVTLLFVISSGKVFLNTYQGNGTQVLSGVQESACYDFCMMNSSCQSADYNKIYQRCFSHTSTSCTAHLTTPPQVNCCNHYKKSMLCL